MLRSLYSYKGGHARTLSFMVDEKFLEIGLSKDPSWVHVISEKGSLGYVPKNYVAVDQIPPVEMLVLIDKCIEGIHQKAGEKESNYSRVEHEALCALVEKRRDWNAKIPPSMRPGKRPAPPLPQLPSPCDSRSSLIREDSLPSLPPSTPPSSLPRRSEDLQTPKGDETINETVTSFISRGESLERDYGDSMLHKVAKSEETSSEEDLQLVSIGSEQLQRLIPKGYYRHLVESIRPNTNISFSTSHQVVTLVLQSLGNTFKTLNPLMNGILQQEECESISGDLLEWETSLDWRRLVEILEKLRQCKDDRQQRSWALYEDEFTIRQLLNDLLDVITNGDGDICNRVLALEDHRPLLNLVQYYQMETRWNIRKLLLQIFTGICHLSKGNISYLSASVLPLELTREILDPKKALTELQYIVLVLGMILCMGDTLPVIHFSTMNEVFIKKILDSIEDFSRDPDTETIGEVFLTLLLAFNLQYHSETSRLSEPVENLVMKVLSQQKHTKYFLEKILILFNREDDPVRMFDHTPIPSNSVLCITGDLYRSESTAQLLYTNDEKVLCDIVLRQITDLPPEDKRRREYMYLLDGIITLGRWSEHKHRQREFAARLASIITKEDSVVDRELAKAILNKIS